MTTVNDFFDEKVQLPSPPAIALKILQAVRQEENSFQDIAAIIKSDPSLTVRVLKIANSSLYGLSNPVTSLAQATGLIGTEALKNIALSFVIVQEFQEQRQGSFNLELFWRRAVTAAVAADVVADAVGHVDHDLFIAGLLQDIGILVLFLSIPDDYTAVLDTKRVNNTSLCSVEKKQFSCDHTTIGALLLESWNIPKSIIEPIRFHHSHKDASEAFKKSALILEIADKIAAIYHGLHSNSKAMEIRSMLEKEWQLSPDTITTIIDTVGERSKEILELFAIDPGEIKPFSLIIQEANQELSALNLSYEQIVLELKQAKENSEQLARELQTANKNLQKLASRDGLTGLYNHLYFHKLLEAERKRSIRYKQPLSLLLIDIDLFKNVNDRYGHPFGDTVLRSVSKTLLRLVRNCDIVARYGGEEYAIILPETCPKGAHVLAQRLRRGIEQEQITKQDHTISVTISIGLSGAKLIEEKTSIQDLIKKSDQALYLAKNNGRNRVEINAI